MGASFSLSLPAGRQQEHDDAACEYMKRLEIEQLTQWVRPTSRHTPAPPPAGYAGLRMRGGYPVAAHMAIHVTLVVRAMCVWDV